MFKCIHASAQKCIDAEMRKCIDAEIDRHPEKHKRIDSETQTGTDAEMLRGLNHHIYMHLRAHGALASRAHGSRVRVHATICETGRMQPQHTTATGNRDTQTNTQALLQALLGVRITHAQPAIPSPRAHEFRCSRSCRRRTCKAANDTHACVRAARGMRATAAASAAEAALQGARGRGPLAIGSYMPACSQDLTARTCIPGRSLEHMHTRACLRIGMHMGKHTYLHEQ
jgi:hypothetical protein